MKEAGKIWEHYSPPQKGLNPQCVFPSQAPKCVAAEISQHSLVIHLWKLLTSLQ